MLNLEPRITADEAICDNDSYPYFVDVRPAGIDSPDMALASWELRGTKRISR